MSNKSIKIAVDVNVLVTEYNDGASIRTLGARYGCSFQNIRARLVNAGVVMRSQAGTRERIALADRVCPTCDKTFHPYHRAQRFCCSEHIRHKTVCKHGHILTEESRYHFPSSESRCKACRREIDRAYRARKKGKQMQ